MRRLPLLVLALAAATCDARADRLHFESGGSIDVREWWIEGDWLMYESEGGTIGVPRASVAAIEPGDHAAPRRPEPAPRPAPRPPSAAERAELRSVFDEAVAAFEARDFESAAARFHEAVVTAPELHAARVGYAASEMALGRDGLALPVVLDGLVLDPERADLLELLGDLRYREDRVDEALRAWRGAFESEPTDRLRDKILKGERDQQASRDFDFSASSHFNVRYDGNVDLELASAMLDYLEERYWELTDRFSHSPSQPITVVLYPTRDFRDVTRAPEWVGGLYDGKIRVPLGGLRSLDPRAKNVLVHELTHAIVHSKTRNNCPRWLHEGLAQMAEDRPLLRADLRGVAEALRALDGRPATALPFSYPASLAFVRHLEGRQGFAGLVHLLDRLGQGDDLDVALWTVFGEDHATLARRWAEGLLAEVRP